MKKTAILVVLLLFLKPIFPVIEYVVNYNYIATVLCENKAKPMRHCNGKCHLIKELAKASDEEKPASSSKKQNQLNDLFVGDITLFSFYYCQTITTASNDNCYANLYSHLDSHSIFHPPIFIS